MSPPEHLGHFAEVTDVKDNGDADSSDKANKATVLIATVQEDEPIVTRKELWSYYRASSLAWSFLD